MFEFGSHSDSAQSRSVLNRQLRYRMSLAWIILLGVVAVAYVWHRSQNPINTIIVTAAALVIAGMAAVSL